MCGLPWVLLVTPTTTHVRELLCHPGMRAAGSPPVHVAGRSQDGLLLLHCGLVQPRPAAFRIGLPAPIADELAMEAVTTEP